MNRHQSAPAPKGRGERRLRAATLAGITAVGITAATLADAADPPAPALFVGSDLLRAVETADEIGAVIGRTATHDTLIAECTSPSSRPGLDEESTPAELAACQASMEAAWRKYFVPSPAADQHDVLVCHGNVIRWFVNRALGNDTRHWTSLDIGHASLTVISVRPDGGTRLIIYSDVGHLPVALQSWAGRGAGWGVPKK